MKICLVGPCSPRHLDSLLNDCDDTILDKFEFFSGLPVSNLAIDLVRLGHEVQIVSTYFGSHEISLEGKNLRAWFLPSERSHRKRALSLWKCDRARIEQKIRSLDFDVIHAHWTYEYALPALKIENDAIITAHDSPLRILLHYRDVYWLLRFFLSFLVRIKTRNLFAVSHHLANDWRSLMF